MSREQLGTFSPVQGQQTVPTVFIVQVASNDKAAARFRVCLIWKHNVRSYAYCPITPDEFPCWFVHDLPFQVVTQGAQSLGEVAPEGALVLLAVILDKFSHFVRVCYPFEN